MLPLDQVELGKQQMQGRLGLHLPKVCLFTLQDVLPSTPIITNLFGWVPVKMWEEGTLESDMAYIIVLMVEKHGKTRA